MEGKNMEDSRDFKLIKTEMFMYKILYSALEKMVKTNAFERCLKKKLIFLMNPINQEDLAGMEKELDNQLVSQHSSTTNIDQPAEKGFVGVLGLSSDMMVKLNKIHFTRGELLLIQDIYFKELRKLLEEISRSVIGIDLEAFHQSSKSLLDEEIIESAKDIHNLVLDNNSEIENNVHLQNNLIKLKYETIPEKELKVVNYEKNKLKDTLQSARDLHVNTLNFIYPSEDCIVRMKEEVCNLEKELSEINRNIDELSRMNEMYLEVDIEELKDIAKHYKEIKSQRRILDMTLKEVGRDSRFNSNVQ